MSAYSDRRWAELARELEFNQLLELRRQADGWRTGLTALTGLLAVLAVLKGRDNLADLPQPSRITAMSLAAAAFLLLLTGSLLAVRASYGRPGAQIILGGQALRQWTEHEIIRIRRSLRAASACCLAGLLLIASGIAISWLSTKPPPTHLIRITTPTTTLCGELITASPTEITIRTTATQTIPLTSLNSITPTQKCP